MSLLKFQEGWLVYDGGSESFCLRYCFLGILSLKVKLQQIDAFPRGVCVCVCVCVTRGWVLGIPGNHCTIELHHQPLRVCFVLFLDLFILCM